MDALEAENQVHRAVVTSMTHRNDPVDWEGRLGQLVWGLYLWLSHWLCSSAGDAVPAQ